MEGMDGSDGLVGRIANFRMWDYELAIDQLNALSCTDKGNIISQHLMDFTYVDLDDSQLANETFICSTFSCTHFR